MSRKKGTLTGFVETLGEAIQTVGAEVGLIEEPKPKTRSAKKALRKAIVKNAVQAEKDAKAARRAVHRRAAGLSPVEPDGPAGLQSAS